MKHVLSHPLGGVPEMSSHKGYGLAAMVEILSTVLTGGFFAATRGRRHPDATRYNVAHFSWLSIRVPSGTTISSRRIWMI